MAEPLILAIDQGTSSTKALLVGLDGAVAHRTTVPIGIAHPRPGWVEQDAEEIWASARTGIADCLGATDRPIAAVAISSQRESALLWDSRTGEPLGPMLGWQDRRTAARGSELVAAGHDDLVRAATGLRIDPMFSALKLAWLLDSLDQKTRAYARAGTVDAWLLHRLTGQHRIEVGNASRTQLLDITTGTWRPDLLALFGIPAEILPEVAASDAPSAPVRGIPGLDGVAVTGVLADSHAALFGHGGGAPGIVKATYGTGSSIMGLLPDDPDAAARTETAGLVRTVAWQLGGAPVPAMAAEGNILSSGSTVTWLAEILGVTPGEVFALAETGRADTGVTLVPAFSGLGAPWWDESARAILTGFDLGTTRADLARAAVESITRQVEDAVAAMDAATGARVPAVHVDGGPTQNPWLLQLQADVSGRDLVRSDVAELSAVGAALAAAIGAGLADRAGIAALDRPRTLVTPADHPADPARAAAWTHTLGLARAGGPAGIRETD